MLWRCSLILIVSYATAAFTKVTINKREHVPQQEDLKFKDVSLDSAKPSRESPFINDNTFTENIGAGENENKLTSLNDLLKFYEKQNAKYKDSSIALKRVKRQYNGHIYGDTLTGYSNYPKTLMPNYLPAAMPNYFSHRKGKQLAIPEQAFTLGNSYLPAAMPSYFSHRKGKELAIPGQIPTSGNTYLPATMPNYFSNRQGNQLSIPEHLFTSNNDYLKHPLDYNVQHNHEYLGKSNENVPMISQDYQDYYAPQEYGNPISNDYYDEYETFQDFLPNYADMQLDKEDLTDEPIKVLEVEKQDINSNGITQQENSEILDKNTQIDSPIEDSNIDDDNRYENEDVHFFAKDYIEFTGDKPGKKEADDPEDDKMEKDDENEEDILVEPEKDDVDSEKNSMTRKEGARVFSIDPEGRISATGLGEEDVKRLIHQVTDIKEGRNLAFMEKFEGLISKMLN